MIEDMLLFVCAMVPIALLIAGRQLRWARRRDARWIDGRGNEYGEAWVQLGHDIDARIADGGATVRRVTKLRTEYETHGGHERLWAWEDAMDQALALRAEAVVIDGRVVTFRYGAPPEYHQRRTRVGGTTILGGPDVQPDGLYHPAQDGGARLRANRAEADRQGRKETLETLIDAVTIEQSGRRWTAACSRCRHHGLVSLGRNLEGDRVALCDDCLMALMEIQADIDDNAL